MMKLSVLKSLAAVILSAGITAGALAETNGTELRIGVSGAFNSVDPMFHNLTPNLDVSKHLFDGLVKLDENLELKPGLAQSWKLVNDTVWEFKLRPGVKFHDGKLLMPEDVIFSIERAPNVPNSPSSFAGYVTSVERVIEIDPLTIHVETKEPNPTLPRDLVNISILSKSAAEGKTTDDFNKGAAAVGTGPFKFVEFEHGRRIVLARNGGYWGEMPAWEKVTILPITNSAARVASLLTGDVDVIAGIPPIDLPKLRENSKITIVSGPQSRIFYLQIDHRDRAPMVFNNDGEVFDKNPLQDLRVRQAMSKAINRQLLIDRVMEGEAVPAGQILPNGFYGANPTLDQADAYDPEGARKLLTEAGYPDGFRMTLTTSHDRYPTAESMVQAIAQMLTRVGIKTDVELAPHSIFRKRGRAGELSVQFGGWGNDGATSFMVGVLHTPDKERGFGPANRGVYSNPAFDQALEEALRTMDVDERLGKIRKATEMVINDLAIIPLYWATHSWGMRKDLAFIPNPLQHTPAMEIRPR
ncbi:ABC transporter substrate-binding protein [Pelagibius litoralis]|uniref:ABC transporter substrate-binding protein n=1 Tax=Pelagibius litoralis TaxID=374515 RepID=A0A967KH67_9PROT|nr:ABC transporter substrate-binding protein [Pelagibius litoralis]NIA70966.1 ABC transporter substrate-binding protein [Pelagibius litoralis]